MSKLLNPQAMDDEAAAEAVKYVRCDRSDWVCSLGPIGIVVGCCGKRWHSCGKLWDLHNHEVPRVF